MKSDPPLELTVTPESIDSFCERLRRSSSTPRRAVAGLATLQTFLGETVEPGNKAADTYRTIRQRIEVHMEAASRELVEQAANSLAQGVQRRDPAAVAAVHRDLSRSGFRQALARMKSAEQAGPLAAYEAWAAEWCKEAERRAHAASGYPDAYDFSGAGIPFEQYAAMRDLCESGIAVHGRPLGSATDDDTTGELVADW